MDDWRYPAIGILCYATTCLYLKHRVSRRLETCGKAYDVSDAWIYQNLSLQLLSFFCLNGLLYGLYTYFREHTFIESVCQQAAYNSPGLRESYEVNYMLKYVELLDTVFMILSGRGVPFIHWYHHITVIIIAWINVKYQMPGQWIVIGINLIIHVWMYGYFAAMISCKRGTANAYEKALVMTRRWITRAQILQFCIQSYGIVWLIRRIRDEEKTCDLSLVPVYVTLFVIGSYLMLFLKFYFIDGLQSRNSDTNIKKHAKTK